MVAKVVAEGGAGGECTQGQNGGSNGSACDYAVLGNFRLGLPSVAALSEGGPYWIFRQQADSCFVAKAYFAE